MPGPSSSLFDPLVLPNGAVIGNRIAKAAMEENMADDDQLPGIALRRLYEAWAKGGAGLIISGNVMIDPKALTGPGGVVLDPYQPLHPFKIWARAAQSGGGQAWLQINHPGRQVYASMGQVAVAPSAVGVNIKGHSHLFAKPRALAATEIAGIVDRFASTARLAEEAGFNGVQIHAAHGYLLSQFLSPLSNHRTDQWGGSLENRARLLLDVVKAVRGQVSPSFCVAVKLNSADFQKGGFNAVDAAQVVRWLNELPVDLVELSGGSYESPAMAGTPQSGSTGRREAYFVDFAREIALVARMPIMVTGGVRRRVIAEDALQPRNGFPGVAMIGIATAMAFEPGLPSRWKRGDTNEIAIPKVEWKKTTLANVAKMAITKVQLRRLGEGLKPKSNLSPLLALIKGQLRTKSRTKRYRAWLTRRNGAA